MAECIDQHRASRSRLDKTKLNEYLDKIQNLVRSNNEREIPYFYHCTSIKARRGIINDGALVGFNSDIPKYAPLASNEDIKGTWFSASEDDRQRKSPYGTQRIMFQAAEMISYLKKNIQHDGETSEANIEESTEDPKLFFECAHHYGRNQYARLLLIRSSDPMISWCTDNLIEIDLHSNPLLQYRNGKLWSRSHGDWAKFIVDVLVVGDIRLDLMDLGPKWSKVGKMQRAGTDPVQGLC